MRCAIRAAGYICRNTAAFSAEEAPLWARIEPLFGDEPWWVRDLASELGEEESRVRALLRKAAQLGHVTAVVVDRYYLTPTRSRSSRGADPASGTRGSPLPRSARRRAQAGDPVLEFFDRSGFTRRKGNEHLLRDGGLFGSESLADKPDGGPAHVGRLGGEKRL